MPFRAAKAIVALFCLGVAGPSFAQSGWDNDATPGLSLFGVPGHVTMPSALALPDGQFALSVNAQGEAIRRGNMAFQITPRLTGVFRYAYLKAFDTNVGKSLYDRSFDVIWHVADENQNGWQPAVAIGLQDFGGTGIYGGEYVVASRHFGPKVVASAGIGWGRYGSHNGFKNPFAIFGDRFKDRVQSSETGRVDFGRFFHGDAALFFGLDWQATDRLRWSVEYSSDAMQDERRVIDFDYRTAVNVGLNYRFDNDAQIGVALLHGSTVALSYSVMFNPAKPMAPSGNEPAPPPVVARNYVAAQSWAVPTNNEAEKLRRAFKDQGLILQQVTLEGPVATVTFSNESWPATAQALGRAARLMTASLPPSVTTFQLQTTTRGMAMRSITLSRDDLESLEYAPDGAWQIWSRAQSDDALAHDLDYGFIPTTSFGLRPYIEPSFFDPDSPLRVDFGLDFVGEWTPMPGLYFSGAIRQKLLGNLDSATRVSDSVLPHVRSDAALYYKDSTTRFPWLTAEYFMRPATDYYTRFAAGWLEPMFGGVSSEVLWAPIDNPLALGVELSHVKQRDYKGLGFLDYAVTTGHISAYYDFGAGYLGQIDVGRYLAGDWGSTITLTRRFDNGFEVGAFFTLTDVSFDDFGEGSFDKGIMLRIPLSFFTGQPTREHTALTLRPILRDGGAMLASRNRLYDLTQDERDGARGIRWARFWR